jgi:hypothetical protein
VGQVVEGRDLAVGGCEPAVIRPCTAVDYTSGVPSRCVRWHSAAPLFKTQIWGRAEAEDRRHGLVVAGGSVRRVQGQGGVNGDVCSKECASGVPRVRLAYGECAGCTACALGIR